MEFLVELLLHAVVEILFYVAAEVLAEIGSNKFYKPAGKQTPLWLKLIACFVWGVIFGGVSLLILSDTVISHPIGRLLNLILLPIFVGFIMMEIGKTKEKFGKQRLLLDYFSYGALFAFGIALTRYIFL